METHSTESSGISKEDDASLARKTSWNLRITCVLAITKRLTQIQVSVLAITKRLTQIQVRHEKFYFKNLCTW